MKCPNGCKTEMKMKAVDKLYYIDNRPIIIKDLSVKMCEECGQETVPIQSVRSIENILAGKSKSVDTIQAGRQKRAILRRIHHPLRRMRPRWRFPI